jgi:hypothetical protein
MTAVLAGTVALSLATLIAVLFDSEPRPRRR